MNKFLYGDREVEIASCYEELSLRQITAYAEKVYPKLPEVFGFVEGQLTIKKPKLLEELYSFMLVILIRFDLPMAQGLFTNQPVMENGKHLADEQGEPMYFNNARFLIYDNKVCDFFLETFLTKNPFQMLRDGKEKLFGPADKFQNIRIEEYFYADTLYMAYKKENNVEYLDRLVATLYRPIKAKLDMNSPEYDGDRRQPFNEHLMVKRAEGLSKLPLLTKMVIFIWYEGCRQWLVETYALLFETTGDGAPVALKPREELVTLCGGWEKYNTNKHVKMLIMFDDMQANLKRAMAQKGE